MSRERSTVSPRTASRSDWVEIFEALGEAFLAVAHSEWQLLAALWKRSFKRLATGLALLGAAVALAFLLAALLVTTAVLFVQETWELSPWQATGAVATVVALVIAVLAAIGWIVYVSKFENPMASARTRLEDHVSWWRQSILQEERALPGGETDEPEKKGPQEQRDSGNGPGGAAPAP